MDIKKICRCLICGHLWVRRTKKEIPTQCPGCWSTNWQSGKESKDFSSKIKTMVNGESRVIPWVGNYKLHLQERANISLNKSIRNYARRHNWKIILQSSPKGLLVTRIL